ncbi:MAG: hypothetical protein WCX73_00490 [Candidatus Pacearchaeota archaeon]|jgi:hypothetical protein
MVKNIFKSIRKQIITYATIGYLVLCGTGCTESNKSENNPLENLVLGASDVIFGPVSGTEQTYDSKEVSGSDNPAVEIYTFPDMKSDSLILDKGRDNRWYSLIP